MKKYLQLLLIVIPAIGVSLYAIYFYVFISPYIGPVSPIQQEAYRANPISIMIHAGFGAIALATGALQYIKKLREKHPNANLILRKTYYLSVLISGISGLYVATYATGGLSNIIGFLLLDILWIYSILMARKHDQSGNMERFRIWILRNYALTFAAVTLRVWLPILWAFYGFRLEAFITIYSALGFLCWVPNLVWIEWYYHEHKIYDIKE